MCDWVRLCSIVELFDYRTSNVHERSIAFDWQNSIERLGSITERSIDYVGCTVQHSC